MLIRKYERFYHAMVLPGLIMLILFNFIPMYGAVMAFQNFKPSKGIFGSQWVGMQNFRKLMMMSGFRQAVVNTLIIAVLKIILGIIVPVFFAVILNECGNRRIKRSVQTICYLPNFLSWVILGVIFTNFFSLNGLFNQFIGLLGAEAEIWMVKASSFRILLILTDTWKNFGYTAIIYLSAMTNISQNMYEAADIDGANRFQKIRYLTLPSITPTVILMTTLSLKGVLDGGFDQVFNMYSELVYSTGDIIDTYIYRIGLVDLKYSMSAAVSLAKSAVSFVLIVLSYQLANKFSGYKIF
ncbi:ABC transporter permease subunit [Beduinella massiliensis]|uniref:ABC transporter permease subunit n=1 Tax=Beduinella massiliensis TaxID=1852363 RepID=UPI000C83E3E6